MTTVRAAALRETAVVYSRTYSGADRYGDPVEAEGAGVTVRCAVQPLDATEDEIGRDTRVQRYRFTVEPTAPVDGLSRVVWRGRTLEVLGEPLPHQGRAGVHHYEFDAREVRG